MATINAEMALDPETVHRTARSIYVDGPLLPRLLSRHRGRVCPFDMLVGLVPSGARVLDVGCGTGVFLGLLWELQGIAAGTGFDVSGPAIGVAASMADRTKRADGSRLRFLRLDAMDPWPAGPYDVVSVIDVLHHVDMGSRQGLIENAASQVAQNGLLVYKDISTTSMWRRIANQVHDLLVAHEWVRYSPLDVVRSWAAGCGLTELGAARVDRLWYRHDIVWWRKP